MIINMTETCKANGITEFSRTRGGWMKLVEGIDKSQKGGYSFIGDNFYKVGNFKTNLQNGIYLDQSTSVQDREKKFTMNLFKIENGEVTLLKSVPKNSGWAEELWDEVDTYFHSKTEITAQDIINTINEMTDSQDIIDEVIHKLSQKEESHYAFKNWWEVKAILSDINCSALPIELIDIHSKKIITEDTYIFKCDELCSKYQYHKKITTFVKIFYETEITENTFIDYKKITPTTFKSKFFQNEISKEITHFIARTIPNATGLHNGIEITLFYFENNTLTIRVFDYYIDTHKADQIGNEVITPQK